MRHYLDELIRPQRPAARATKSKVNFSIFHLFIILHFFQWEYWVANIESDIIRREYNVIHSVNPSHAVSLYIYAPELGTYVAGI